MAAMLVRQEQAHSEWVFLERCWAVTDIRWNSGYVVVMWLASGNVNFFTMGQSKNNWF